MKTLEDIYTELDQISDEFRFQEHCYKQYQTSNKAELIAACTECGLTVKKTDKKDTMLTALRRDYERKMEVLDARASALQEERAVIKAQIAAQVKHIEKTVQPVTVFNFQPFFKALALAIASFVLPCDVVGAENIAIYDDASVEFLRWCEAHPDVNITPLVFGYFVEHEPEQPEEMLDDAIARLLDTMNKAAQESDYPTWYEAAEEMKLLQCVEDTNPTRLKMPEWARK